METEGFASDWAGSTSVSSFSVGMAVELEKEVETELHQKTDEEQKLDSYLWIFSD